MIDGQGNASAPSTATSARRHARYTESRMTRLAGEMLADIDSDTVDFTPNYDESATEPNVLPARVPNLIINGSTGIAVGMATNIPPHNLTEVVNACIDLINDPAAGIDAVLKHVTGPDFPTGGFIYGKSGIANAYKTGRGRFLMRAKCLSETIAGRQYIVVTEIPYQVNKSTLIKRIAELITDKVIDDISDVRDESDRDGMRIVIELKRGAQQEIVLNQLFKHTQMQESFSMIFLAVHNGQPKELPLDKAIHAFLDHRVEVVRRRTAFLLGKARDREHILLGYQIALDHLDNVIKTIRQSSSRDPTPAKNLFAYFSGKTIKLKGKLRASRSIALPDPPEVQRRHDQLAHRHADPQLPPGRRHPRAPASTAPHPALHRRAPQGARFAAVRGDIAEFESILASEKKLRKVIVKELEDIRDRYGDARRTVIIDESSELTLEDLIVDEQVAVTVSNTGYLKRTPLSTYRQQRRGGTGRIGMKTREEDFVAQLIIDSTHAYLLCFTNTGRVYWLKVYEIPDISAAGKGKAMASLVDLQPGEKVVTILPVRDLEEEGKNVFFATRNGTIKKTALKDFSNVMSRGIIAIGIDKDDELITCKITDGQQIIFLATHDGKAIRFHEDDVRTMGRPAFGVRGISLAKGDYVIGAAVTPSAEARNKRRLELAAAAGLAKLAKAAIEEEARLAKELGAAIFAASTKR